jgi:hypothetical protein
MKVLLDSNVPFALAHGGAQIQIEQTKKELEEVGVENEQINSNKINPRNNFWAVKLDTGATLKLSLEEYKEVAVKGQ